MPATVSRECARPAGAVWPGGASAGAVRLALWALWAVVLVGVYYLQLWRALVTGDVFPEEGLLSVTKHVAALAVAALAAGAIAVPAGMAIERLLGWPRLAAAPAFSRRVASGTVAILAVLGPLHAPAGDAVQAFLGGVLPHIGEASVRALSGIFGLMAVVAAAVPAGQVVCGWLG